MTGHAMPWNKEKSGQQKEDEAKARELGKKQENLLSQQEKELAQRRKKMNQQALDFLRARFGATSASVEPQTPSDSAGSLFNRITGR